MKRFWLSWYHSDVDHGAFELHSPWWTSGTRLFGETVSRTICAAVIAKNGEEARERVRLSYDRPPEPDAIEWRFCEAKDDEWSPFNDRFQRAKWMAWPVTP